MARARTTKARKGGGKPPLGWITPKKRTPEQHAAHYAAVSHMPKFTIQNLTQPGGPVKVILTDFWRKKEVVDAIGREFTGFHQLTGSCVGASGGNFIATLAFIQFFLSDSPTKPFIPWWPFSYGRTRFNEGDRGQGEGAIDSVLLQTFKKEGVYGIEEVDDEPQFDTSDGFTLTNRVELQYSDGAAEVVTKYLALGAKHPLGTAAPISDTTQMRDAIINGYPVIDGCDNFIGHGSIKGDGANAYVTGKYDGRGGHSTCLAADTKVPLLDGTEKTVGEMAKSGGVFWVYSYDAESGKVVPKPAVARVTRPHVPEGMTRVILDNGQSVTTTPDHRFMLRDGTYRQAAALRAGDSLMPLYRKTSDSKRHPGYEMVMDPGTEAWELTHRRVSEFVSLPSLRFRRGELIEGDLPLGTRPVIHHRDFGKRNNDPHNLSRMTSREHWRYHASVADGVWERMDPAVAAARKARMGAWVKKLWADPGYRVMMREISVHNMKQLRKRLATDPRLYAAHVQRSSAYLKGLWADPEWRAKRIEGIRQAMSTPEARVRLTAVNRKKAKDPAFLTKLKEGSKRGWSDPEVKARRVAAITASRKSPEYRAMMAEAQRKRWARRAVPKNHKVVGVIHLPTETGPVYCLEIPGTHNFAVSAGVFVHNCFLGYWDHPNDGPLFLYSNQWPAQTYPKDPAGGGRCTVWAPESEVAKLFRTGGQGETFAGSHLSYFPAQPKVLALSDIV